MSVITSVRIGYSVRERCASSSSLADNILKCGSWEDVKDRIDFSSNTLEGPGFPSAEFPSHRVVMLFPQESLTAPSLLEVYFPGTDGGETIQSIASNALFLLLLTHFLMFAFLFRLSP